ncbi:Uma2 family endonuclease [Cohnella sp.]|uniref:Uma2 family endonuclease n=1 Tax=Cohnella sp. TaxID=1883426 RepID=UPI00356A1D48
MEKKNKAKDQIKEQQVTYETYAAMPDDGQRYEIVDGSMEMMTPSPSTTHQAVSGELEFVLKQSCKSDYLIYDAPLDVILSETNVLQPDILMIHRSRQHIVTDRGIEGPPDLVVEILSPSSRKRDKVIKMRTYAKHGVQEYWIVDSATRILEQFQLIDSDHYELCNLFEGDDTVSDKLPCVSFVISDIFREIPVF